MPRRRLAPPTLVGVATRALPVAVVMLFVAAADASAQRALHSSDAGAIPAPVLHECTQSSMRDSIAASDDSLGMNDDSLAASALPPESGLVLIDRTGHEVHTAPAPIAPVRDASSESVDRPRCARVVAAIATTSKR